MKKNDIIELKIDTLVYEGEGIGKIDGLAVFVPDTAPGDVIKAEIISVKKNYAKAVLKEIITPSTMRSKPFCALANACGGCQWQHIRYNEQLVLKRNIVEETVSKISGINVPVNEVIRCENNVEYRCKVQYPVQRTKVSKRFLVGYYKKGSHELINIKHCPIQPRIIDVITEFIRKKAQDLLLSAYDEQLKSGLIRHLVFRYSKSNNNLTLTIVVNSDNVIQRIKELCLAVKKEFKQVEGIFVNFNKSKNNVVLGRNFELLLGNDFIEEKLDDKTFKISSGSFFQVNPEAAKNLFNEVHKIIKSKTEKPKILDVYSGVGTFSIWLKDIASQITAIEENQQAVIDAKENIESNKLENDAPIEILQGNADSVMKELIEQGETFDITVLDPPRKGCSTEAIELVTKLTDKYIIYVSCNPATLARDIKLFGEKSFIPEYIQPVDMFCHTYHIESIAVLRKEIGSINQDDKEI